MCVNQKQGDQRVKKPIEVCLDIVHESKHAFCVTDGGPDEWIPKSQIRMEEDIDDIGPGDTIVFTMPEWLATKKGFI